MKKCVNRSKSRNKLLWIILFLGFVCSFSIANAQQQTVSGKITDNKGEGLIGVTVVITGTTTGVVTDYNGEFSISAPVGSELTISFLGYKTQTVVVGTETRIDIKLKAEDVQLEGVTVTALGVKRANRDIGYSVQVVGGEDLMKSQSPNALSSLVGKAAGLTVANSAEMLGSPDLIIRGASDVLIVVDGVPVNSDGFNLNPNDIESYTILKGPNAAALYGFRGQNGAVLITTKKGSDEKVKVEFNSSTSVDAGFISISEVQSDYGIGSNYQYAFGDGPMDQGGKYTRSNVWGPRFEGQDVPQWNSPIDPETGKRTGTPFNSYPDNYEDFLKTGYQTANNLSVATNYDRFHSRISLGHNHTDYMIPNTKLDMYNANIYTGFKVTNKLNIEGNLNYSKQYSNNVPEVWYGPNSYTYMFGVYGTRHYNIEDMEDYWMPGMEGVQQRSYEYGRANNPYFMAYEWTRKHDKTDVHGYVKMDYDLTTDLNVSLRSQVTSWDWFRDERVRYSANKYGREQEKAGDYEEDKRKMFENNTDLLMTYNKTFASDFRLSALAGGNIRTFKYNSSWACADYLVVPGIYNFSNSLNPPRVYNYESEMAVHSGYASLDVAFKKYATLSAAGRIDKLSTLPEGNNTFFYPSITLASMMTDYIDMPDFISTVKPRASYANVKGGLTNSSIGPAFVALGYVHPLRPSAGWFYYTNTSYNGPSYANQDVYNTGILYESEPAVTLSPTMANPSLQPYTVNSYEGGIELGFFDNRIYTDFTYFMMYNGPQIFEKTAAPSTGFTSEMINGIITKKSGYEISLNLVPIAQQNGLRWQIGLNYANYKEVLQEGIDGEGVTIRDQYFEVGDRMDAIYGRMYNRTADGAIIHDETGLPVFSPSGVDNLKKLGYANPDYVWGITNQINYKNWNMSFQFDGRVGGIMYSELYARQFQSGTSPTLVDGAMGEARLTEWEHYKETGELEGKYISPGVRIVSGTPEFENGYIVNLDELELEENGEPVRLQAFSAQVMGNVDEHFVVSKTYAKLREVTLGYTFPQSAFSGGRIQGLSISLVGKNLLYFAKHTNIIKGMDMDEYGEGYDVAKSSLTFRAPHHRTQSPTTRQIGLNLRITF